MSFKSEAATVRSGLKSGSYKKADPDPYGLMGFAEQVTFGIRAEAEQRRKEDLLKKKEEAAATKLRNEKIAAKEAADKKLKGYITRAMANVTGGYNTPVVDTKGMSGMNERIFIEAQDRGLTTYAQIEDLLKGNNFQTAIDLFYSPNSTDINVNTNTSVGTSDVSSDNKVSTKIDTSTNTENLSTSDNLETAANRVNTQTDNLFGNSTDYDMNTLKMDNWEAEIDRVLKQGRDMPNKYPNAEETAQKIRDEASSKGWVTYGGLSTSDIRSKTSAELEAEIDQMEAGIGGQNVTDEDIAQLKEFAVAKKAIEQEGAFWNNPQEIFTKLADEKDRSVLEAELKLWKLTGDQKDAVKNIENAVEIFDAVQNNKPITDEILEKMVGADVGVIEGLKAVYGNKANPAQKVTIEKLISLANEKEAANRKPKELAFTSWAARTGLAENLASTDETVRKQAEKDIAAWEKLWSGRTSIAQKPKDWWQDAKNLSKMSLNEVELLLDSGTITAENNKEAYAALLRLKPTLEGQATESGSSELANIKTLDELNRYLIANEAKFEGNDALKATWTKMHVELQRQEAAANEGKTIDPKENARRQWMEDNNIENPSAMTFEQIGAMEKAVSELISPAAPAEIITSSEMFRVGNSYVKRSTDGKLRDIFTNQVVTPSGDLVPVPESIRREISKDYTRIRDDLLTPMANVQSKSLGTIRSAKRLSELATKNPEVLTTVGTAASFLGRLSINLDTLTNYANQQLTPDQVVDQVMNEQLQGTASAQALFDAEILKYAYLYASVNLEQSGRGLSDTDFKQALRQVKASDGKLETFEALMRQLTNETIGKVRSSVENIFGSTETGKGMNSEVASLESMSGQPIGNYPRNMDEFVKFNRLEAEMAWLKGGPSTSSSGNGGGNGGGETDFLGDGLTLEGIRPEMISNIKSQYSQIQNSNLPETSLLNILRKRNPKLSEAQLTLVIKQMEN